MIIVQKMFGLMYHPLIASLITLLVKTLHKSLAHLIIGVFGKYTSYVKLTLAKYTSCGNVANVYNL